MHGRVTLLKAPGNIRITYTDAACLHASFLQPSASCVVRGKAPQQLSQDVDPAGGAADGETEQEWPKTEQRALCRACQEALADGQLAEVVRLLQRLHLGQLVVDKDLAWHLLEV